MYIDIIAGIIVIIGVLIGVKKGFFFEILSFFILMLDVVLAKQWTPSVFNYIKKSIKLNEGIAYFFIYLGVLLGIYIVTSIVLSFLKRTLPKMFNGIIDSILGGILGGLKGCFVMFILLMLFNFSTTLVSGLDKYSKSSIVNKFFLENITKLEGYSPSIITEKLEDFQLKKNIDKQLKDFMSK